MSTDEPVAMKPALPFVRVIPLLFLCRIPLDRYVDAREVSWIAALLNLLILLAHDAWLAEPVRRFSSAGFAPVATGFCLMACACYLLQRWRPLPLPALLVFSLWLEIVAWIALPVLLLHDAATGDAFDLDPRFAPACVVAATALWLLPVARLMTQLFAQPFREALPALLLYGVVTVVPVYFLAYAQEKFWYHEEAQQDDDNAIVDDEALFFSQDDLVEDELDRVVAETPGHIDLYYLGFGSYAGQAVFRREIHFLQGLFDRNGEETHGVSLVNSVATADTLPLALHQTLDHALQGLAGIMNPEEDILFVYLTSHGSSDHTLAIDFEPYRFADLTPEQLRQALDDAGIRWRVIVVSACYSGGFIEALKDDHTLVATASDADHTSFGCSNENEFTYYGEALLRDQLAQGTPLPEAFPRAMAAIADRERREKITPSHPQLWVAPLMAQHLRDYEAGLKPLQASARAP